MQEVNGVAAPAIAQTLEEAEGQAEGAKCSKVRSNPEKNEPCNAKEPQGNETPRMEGQPTSHKLVPKGKDQPHGATIAMGKAGLVTNIEMGKPDVELVLANTEKHSTHSERAGEAMPQRMAKNKRSLDIILDNEDTMDVKEDEWNETKGAVREATRTSKEARPINRRRQESLGTERTKQMRRRMKQMRKKREQPRKNWKWQLLGLGRKGWPLGTRREQKVRRCLLTRRKKKEWSTRTIERIMMISWRRLRTQTTKMRKNTRKQEMSRKGKRKQPSQEPNGQSHQH